MAQPGPFPPARPRMRQGFKLHTLTIPQDPSPSLFESALDALPDGVLVISNERRVIYANPAFVRHWRIPSALLDSSDETKMLRHASAQLVDPESFRREVEELHATDRSFQDELQFKDGRIFSRRSVPFHVGERFQARIWIFTDVTEARHSYIDALSGVPNRRAYSRDFPLFAAAADDGLLRAAAILDIDNFKAYNDHYGHAAGDVVLRQVGALLRTLLRNDDDLVFRIGGEEFLLASKPRTMSDARLLFDGVRQAVAAAAIPHAGNPPDNVVTISIGYGVFRGPRRAGDIFENIDAALYRAKAEGRDRLCEAVLA